MSEKATLEDKLNKSRIFNLSASELLPHIQDCKTRATEDLIAAFRSGKDLIGPAARLEAYSTIIEDIKCKAVEFDHLVTKHQKENSK